MVTEARRSWPSRDEHERCTPFDESYFVVGMKMRATRRPTSGFLLEMIIRATHLLFSVVWSNRVENETEIVGGMNFLLLI